LTTTKHAQERIHDACTGRDALRWVEVAIKTDKYDVTTSRAIAAYIGRRVEPRTDWVVESRNNIEFSIKGEPVRAELLSVIWPDIGRGGFEYLLCDGELLLVPMFDELDKFELHLKIHELDHWWRPDIAYPTSPGESFNAMRFINALVENGMLQKIWVPPSLILEKYNGESYYIFMLGVECEYAHIGSVPVQMCTVMKRKRRSDPMERVW
jgi:hypothetical protein